MEVRFTDAHLQQWTFVDKWPVFSGEDLHPDSSYLVEVGVLCDILTTGNSADTADTSSSKCGLIN
ncbi:hypothetical protein ABZZ17_39235 [Streptomyces sp. NPDC006512]|uniref:hypothetical protein n=1 Tax=Streptomyces sp. NPDC006512 TaxID=3154307 RepID=UPI0033B6E3AE